MAEMDRQVVGDSPVAVSNQVEASNQVAGERLAVTREFGRLRVW